MTEVLQGEGKWTTGNLDPEEGKTSMGKYAGPCKTLVFLNMFKMCVTI